MLTIRQAQMDKLVASQRTAFIETLCEHLATYFPDVASALDASELRARLRELLDGAEAYGLESRRDQMRFVNLAAAYGWDFDRRPDTQWMRGYMTDPDVSSPSMRLHRLVARCILESRSRAMDAGA